MASAAEGRSGTSTVRQTSPCARIVVVGGSGMAATAFRGLLSAQQEFEASALVRRPTPPAGGETVTRVSDYFSLPETSIRRGDVVVNFVGLTGNHREEEFRRVNVDGLAQLAAFARSRGASRFIQISSLSVYGPACDIGPETLLAPATAYGRSKAEGDRALAQLSGADFSVTLLRVPILYGPGTGAKLAQLARLLSRTGFLPVPRRLEPRSTLHIDNLALGIVEAIRRELDGVRFLSDPEPFRLDILAEVVARRRGTRVSLVALPDLLFQPIRIFLPQIYNSLYARSLISPGSCVPLPAEKARPLRAALEDILPGR